MPATSSPKSRQCLTAPTPNRSSETADIAVLLFVYRVDTLIAQKIGLLQSKRLYPANNDVEDDDPVGFAYGMNAFLRRDGKSPLGKLHRVFEFTDSCAYGALDVDGEQVESIRHLNELFGDAAYFLFYNPPDVPVSVRYPISAYQTVASAPLGCRVYAVADVDAVLKSSDKRAAPTLAALEAAGPASNWRLETWAADLLLRCKVGQQYGEDRAELVERLL